MPTLDPLGAGRGMAAGQRYGLVVLDEQCLPCREVLPVAAAAARLAPVAVVWVGERRRTEPQEEPSPWLAEVSMDRLQCWNTLAVRGFPSAFAVGRDGRIQAAVKGSVAVESLLAVLVYHNGIIPRQGTEAGSASPQRQ